MEPLWKVHTNIQTFDVFVKINSYATMPFPKQTRECMLAPCSRLIIHGADKTPRSRKGDRNFPIPAATHKLKKNSLRASQKPHTQTLSFLGVLQPFTLHKGKHNASAGVYICIICLFFSNRCQCPARITCVRSQLAMLLLLCQAHMQREARSCWKWKRHRRK